MSAFKDAAADYARRGWAVFPLKGRNKTPAVKGGFKSAVTDVAQIGAWWSAHPQSNVGVATGYMSGGLLVVDIDVDPDTGEDGMEALRDWEREHGELPETVSAITGRGGYHLYYRTGERIGCSANKELGVDIRCDGGFVVAPPSVHPNGNRYEWENHPEDFEVAEADANVLAFVAHVQGGRKPGERFELPEEIPKGGRNDTLFKYASSLQGRGYDDDYIAMAVATANKERCDPPLREADVTVIVESVTGRYEKGRRPQGDKVFRKLDRYGNPTGPVLHNVVAHELIEAHRACIIDGAPAIWDGNRYATGWAAVNRATIDLIDDCKIADQREIRNYVLHKAPKVRAARPTLLAFANGVLDLHGGLVPQDAGMVITNIVPHDYDPVAYHEGADRFLDEVSCGDAAVRANLEEVVGMCMYRANDFGKCPVLIGAGANGKSVFIRVLRYVLGDDNVSTLDLAAVGKQFQAVRLLGKLANLGDDISNERLSGDVLAVFKKVVTGEWIYTDVKNNEGFDFKPYCTLVFSCNEFPKLGDSSEGMMRRLFPIPFDAHFAEADPGFDPRLAERLSCEGAARYLVRLGVEGLRRVIARNAMTPNERSEEIVRDVRNDNNSILQWMEDELLGESDFDEQIIEGLFDRYKDWCIGGGLHPFSRKSFTQKVNAHFGFKSTPALREFSTGRRQVRVFRKAKHE